MLTLTNDTKLPLKADAIVTVTQQLSFFFGGAALVELQSANESASKWTEEMLLHDISADQKAVENRSSIYMAFTAFKH